MQGNETSTGSGLGGEGPSEGNLLLGDWRLPAVRRSARQVAAGSGASGSMRRRHQQKCGRGPVHEKGALAGDSDLYRARCTTPPNADTRGSVPTSLPIARALARSTRAPRRTGARPAERFPQLAGRPRDEHRNRRGGARGREVPPPRCAKTRDPSDAPRSSPHRQGCLPCIRLMPRRARRPCWN